jgi:hypothetical protein
VDDVNDLCATATMKQSTSIINHVQLAGARVFHRTTNGNLMSVTLRVTQSASLLPQVSIDSQCYFIDLV